MAGQQRGAKALTARDWLFGSRPRRLVLRFILNNEPPAQGWTKTNIAIACGLSPHGGAAANVDGLVALGILKEIDHRYWPASIEQSLLSRVAALVEELESVPEVTIEELRKG